MSSHQMYTFFEKVSSGLKNIIVLKLSKKLRLVINMKTLSSEPPQIPKSHTSFLKNSSEGPLWRKH